MKTTKNLALTILLIAVLLPFLIAKPQSEEIPQRIEKPPRITLEKDWAIDTNNDGVKDGIALSAILTTHYEGTYTITASLSEILDDGTVRLNEGEEYILYDDYVIRLQTVDNKTVTVYINGEVRRTISIGEEFLFVSTVQTDHDAYLTLKSMTWEEAVPEITFSYSMEDKVRNVQGTLEKELLGGKNKIELLFEKNAIIQSEINGNLMIRSITVIDPQRDKYTLQTKHETKKYSYKDFEEPQNPNNNQNTGGGGGSSRRNTNEENETEPQIITLNNEEEEEEETNKEEGGMTPLEENQEEQSLLDRFLSLITGAAIGTTQKTIGAVLLFIIIIIILYFFVTKEREEEEEETEKEEKKPNGKENGKKPNGNKKE